MKRFYDFLEFIPLILIFATWLAMVISFFGSFYLPVDLRGLS